MTRSLELSLPAIPVSVREARDQVAGIAARWGADKRVVEDLRLCVSEAVTNVVRHAYEEHGGSVDVLAQLEDDRLTVAVRDRGDGMSEFRSDGDLGYGLRIIDKLTLRHTISSAAGGGTEVVMVFGLDPRGRRNEIRTNAQYR